MIFIYPVDFVVIEIEKVSNLASQVLVILERPFLATANVVTNCRNGMMTTLPLLELFIFLHHHGIYFSLLHHSLQSNRYPSHSLLPLLLRTQWTVTEELNIGPFASILGHTRITTLLLSPRSILTLIFQPLPCINHQCGSYKLEFNSSLMRFIKKRGAVFSF